MGLEGFLSFVKKKYPNIILNEHITTYSHHVVFMDISSYIYKYVCIFGNSSTRWIGCLYQLFLNLKSYRVHVIPVFDGKPPDEKKDEIDDRKQKRNQTKEKIKQLESSIVNYRSKTISQEENELLKKTIEHLHSKNKCTKLKTLLFKTNSTTDTITLGDITDIENYIEEMKKTMFYVGSKEIDLVKELLTILGIPYIQAPEEAEACCSYLCKRGDGSAVISCDTDCFAHGCPTTIITYDTTEGTIAMINIKDLLNELELNQEEFVDFCILIGCDYNRKVKVKNIGPVKALDLIKKYKKIENIKEYDFSVMNYATIRPLFNPVYDNIKIKHHRKIDRDALETFLDEHNISYNLTRLNKIIYDIEKEVEIEFE